MTDADKIGVPAAERATSAQGEGSQGATSRVTQLKAAMDGMGYAAQVEALTPRPAERAHVQRARTAASEPEVEQAAPVQRRQIHYVQRRSLAQAGLDGGLTDVGKSALVGMAFQGTKYRVTVPQANAAADRTGALTKAAEVNAGLGAKLNAASPGGVVSYTRKEANLGNAADKNTIDPFVLEVVVPFTKDGAAATLTIVYQHANGGTGYVISVTDTTNAATAGGAQMFAAKKGEGPPAGNPNAKYPMDHDETNGANTAGMTNTAAGANATEQAASIDAYTKIAGEGARWLCVRNHASAVQNDTFFFTAQAGDATKVWGVTFSVLWKTWNEGFKKAYNIPDGKVVEQLNNGFLKGLREGRDRSALTGKDYDLDKSKAHVAAPPDAH